MQPQSSDPSAPSCPDDIPLRAGDHGPRRGSLLYFGASILVQASALLRYVLLARLLGPHQLGLAAALTVTAGFFDLISDTGSDRFLIQDRDGDAPAVQRLVQLVTATRGVLVSLGLALFAIPIAGFYGTPALAGGLVLLALSPVIAGFLNLDMRRVQRHLDFRPEAIAMMTAELLGLAAVVLAALIRRDFLAVAFGLIARSLVLVACSHLLARRPFRLGWDRAHAPRLARFAAPLMLNGLMLFIVSQGDRVIVANRLGVTELGYYSAVILLINYPSGVVSSYIHALFTPMIAARRDVPSERDRVADALGGQTVLLGLAMAVGFALIAPFAIPLLFGARFAQAPLLIAFIGLLQATRFLLTWPTTVALAMGRTTTVLFSNMAHLLILPGAALGLLWIGGLPGIVAGFLAGEFGAAAVALVLMNRACGRRSRTGFSRLIAIALTGAVMLGWHAALGQWPAETAMLAASLALLAWLLRREAAVLTDALLAARRLGGALLPRLRNKGA